MFHIIINIKNDRYNNKLCQPNEYLPHYFFHRYLFDMRLSLLDILKEEIKEQGYGRLYQSLKLSPEKKAGDISGYDFETKSTIKKSEPVLKEPEVGSYSLEDTEFEIEGDLSSLSKFSNKGKPLKSNKYFILHHTGGRGNAEGVINTLNTRDIGVLGVQWIIDLNAKIYQGLPLGSKGAHVSSGKKLTSTAPPDLSNETAQGVEIIANDDSDVTLSQCFSALKLVKSLGFDLSNIYGHGEVNNHKQKNEGQKCKKFFKENWNTPYSEILKKI